MLMDGIPIPVPMTDTARPQYWPVKPSMLRTAVTCRASSRKVSAIHWARKGSPGRSTSAARSPGSQAMWGVDTPSRYRSGSERPAGLSSASNWSATKGPTWALSISLRLMALPPSTTAPLFSSTLASPATVPPGLTA